MTQDIIDLLVKMLEEQKEQIKDLKKTQEEKIDAIEEKLDSLIAFKNRLIACGVLLSALFAYLWDFFKSLFYRG